MTRTEYLETLPLVGRARWEWSPTTKLILAFILGLLALTPALLGIYWEPLLSMWAPEPVSFP